MTDQTHPRPENEEFGPLARIWETEAGEASFGRRSEVGRALPVGIAGTARDRDRIALIDARRRAVRDERTVAIPINHWRGEVGERAHLGGVPTPLGGGSNDARDLVATRESV